MKAGTVGLLVGLGVVAVAGGWYLGTRTTPSEQTSVAGGALMFPDLAARLRDAARLEITQKGKRTVIEKRGDGGWGVASMRDYPVQEAKLRGLLTALTELRLVEQRTNDPGEFARLGVDDPKAAASGAALLRVVNAASEPILSVIVGHRRVRGQTNVPEEVYVRRPDENQSWLAEGNLQVDADEAQWLDRNIMNIAHDRVTSVTVGPGLGVKEVRRDAASDGADGDKALIFTRPDAGKFALTEPSEHPKLEDYKVEDVSRALELLTFQTVKADADATGVETGHSVFTLNDGLVVKVTVLHADNDVWARFAVSGSSETVKAEADRLAARVTGWSYQIGSWKEKSLVPTLDSLKAEDSARTADGLKADELKAEGDLKVEDSKPVRPAAGAVPDADKK